MKSRRTTHVVILCVLGMILLRHPHALIAQGRYLVWSDEFNGPSIDNSHWQFGKGNTNDNLQYYTDRIQNAQISGGLLQIIARKESYAGFNYTSALLETRDAVSWRYGRIEARAKVPGTPGFVPAFWMMPADAMYGWWPYSGEIDIMEYPTTQAGTIYGTLHARAYSYFTGTVPLGATFPVADAETAFHIYAVEWSPEQIDFFVDQNKYFTVTNDHSGYQRWPFDQPFYIILNVGVGGAWVGAPTQSTAFPAIMEIDYVRVYEMLSDISISGKDYVAPSAQGVTYAIPQIAGGTYTWTVPSMTQIVAGQNTSTIIVNWGNAGGDVSALTTISSASTTSHYLVEVSNNLLSNPGFEKGVKYWKGVMSAVANGSFGLDTSTAAHVGHSVRTIVNATPANPWDTQISQQGFNLEVGKQYEGRLWARSAVSGAKLNAAVINAQTYALYGGTTFILTDTWKQYIFRFTASQTAPGSFNMDFGSQPATYYCDDVVLVKLDGQSGIRTGTDPIVPRECSLGQNYPNPFNPVTTIGYRVAGDGSREPGSNTGNPEPATLAVRLVVCDLQGREVAVLVNGKKAAGSYEVGFDASGLASGMYFYRLQAGDFVQTRKMVVVK